MKMQLFRDTIPTHNQQSAKSRRLLVVQASATTQQRCLHVCTSKTCRRQGSAQIYKFVKDLGLEDLSVEESACLGNCGNGPNAVLMPGEVRLRHVSTPTNVIGILHGFNIDIEPNLLKATQLRLAGNALAVENDLQGAISKYQEALDLNPSRGKHMLYSNLSATHLQLGQKEAALEAARSSVQLAPKGFHMAYVRLVDALYGSGKFEEAAAVLQQAVAQDPGFKTIPEYKIMAQALRKYKPKVLA